MAFAPGDIVALKSGGHSMTVIAIEAEEVDCLWLNDAGELFRQSIPAIALTMIEQSEADEDDAEEDHDEDDEDEDDDDDDEDEDEEDDEDGEKRRKKA
ncbi:MAG TPA: DUF2158 domain-containing protein [Xanthobacteraceae bacterium]|jgi:uncharacterized protein YodC (DUF2158 family)|nr:DUF2158 domain-containing protein [Xanthobacteraceae bacterium]